MFYASIGTAPINKKVALDRKNILVRSYMYARMSMRGGICSDLPSVLLSMARSANYYVAAEWVVRYQGTGMDLARANCAFKMLVTPGDFQMENIRYLFFDCVTREEKSKYRLWADTVHHDSIAAQRLADPSAGNDDIFAFPADHQEEDYTQQRKRALSKALAVDIPDEGDIEMEPLPVVMDCKPHPIPRSGHVREYRGPPLNRARTSRAATTTQPELRRRAPTYNRAYIPVDTLFNPMM